MKSLYALRFTLHASHPTLLIFHSTPLALRRGVGGEAFIFHFSLLTFYRFICVGIKHHFPSIGIFPCVGERVEVFQEVVKNALFQAVSQFSGVLLMQQMYDVRLLLVCL